MNVEPQKVFDKLSERHAQKIAKLEQEVAILLVSNQQLTDELAKLQGAEQAVETE